MSLHYTAQRAPMTAQMLLNGTEVSVAAHNGIVRIDVVTVAGEHTHFSIFDSDAESFATVLASAARVARRVAA